MQICLDKGSHNTADTERIDAPSEACKHVHMYRDRCLQLCAEFSEGQRLLQFQRQHADVNDSAHLSSIVISSSHRIHKTD